MTGSYSECQIRLHRDALNTPWGFRLQGGKDFKTPLTIQRVFVGSPADGELHRGDVLVAIDNYDTNNLTHKLAQDAIKNTGGSLSLRIKRGANAAGVNKPLFNPPDPAPQTLSPPGSYRSRPLDTTTLKPDPRIGAFSPPRTTGPAMQSFGTDYSRAYNAPPQHGMLNRVQESLNSTLWSSDDGQDIEYEKKPMHEIQRMFSDGERQHARQRQQPQPKSYNEPGQVYGQQTGKIPSYQPSRRQPWRKPETDGQALPEPGWAPQSSNAPTTWQPPVPAESMVNRSQQTPPRQQYQTEQVRHRDMGRPAWSGSLRGHGGPKPWEVVAGETLVPGGIDANTPSRGHSASQQAPQSQSYQPHQHHSPNVQPHNPHVQNVHYAPGQAPQYQGADGAAADSDSAAIVHTQYNSPLGLYSKENVQAALSGQTAGKPGQGTMQVVGPDGKKQFNPAQSDVYRLLQEEEGVREYRQNQQAQQQQSQQQNHHQHPQQHSDHSQRSPMMAALEQYCIEEGTSDF